MIYYLFTLSGVILYFDLPNSSTVSRGSYPVVYSTDQLDGPEDLWISYPFHFILSSVHFTFCSLCYFILAVSVCASYEDS